MPFWPPLPPRPVSGPGLGPSGSRSRPCSEVLAAARSLVTALFPDPPGSRFVRVSVPAAAGASCKGWCFWFVMIAQDSSPQIIVFFATVERILFRPPRAASHAADRSLRRLPLSPRRLCIALAKVLMTKRILYLNDVILLFVWFYVKGFLMKICVYPTNNLKLFPIFRVLTRIFRRILLPIVQSFQRQGSGEKRYQNYDYYNKRFHTIIPAERPIIPLRRITASSDSDSVPSSSCSCRTRWRGRGSG